MGKRILLIEDEEIMNARLINKLKAFHEVELAISIDAAINVLKMGKEFDLIILDIMMSMGPYDEKETDEGTETGCVFYDRELRNLNTKIVLWTRNKDMLNKPWGPNVAEVVLKSTDENQLVEMVNRNKRVSR